MISLVLASMMVLHLDFNTVQMKKGAVVDALRNAAAAGYNAVLWEVENKVRWETCPECVHPEAFDKDEFRAILAEAERLGMEPIPLLQTIGHAEYVLGCEKYAGWMERSDFPACYCTSRPEVRAFLKRFVHEYLKLFGPKVRRFHLGGDEAIVFGTCPQCSNRDPMELYAEHLDAVAAELRERGVKPGVWSDMALMGGDWKRKEGYEPDPKLIAKLSTDYTLWNWDYSFGTGSDHDAVVKGKTRLYYTPMLTKLGYEVIVCGASASYQDTPFLPFYRRHRDNLSVCAGYARERQLSLCVTSWSVHLSSKELQYPLWDFAAKRFLHPAASAKEDFGRCVLKRLGEVDGETLCRLAEGGGEYPKFDARTWEWLKPAKPAVAGHLERSLKKAKTEIGLEKLAKMAKADATAVEKALAELRKQGNAAAMAPFLEGGELTQEYLKAIAAVAEGRTPEALPVERTSVFYGRLQTPASANNSSALAWSVLGTARKCGN